MGASASLATAQQDGAATRANDNAATRNADPADAVLDRMLRQDARRQREQNGQGNAQDSARSGQQDRTTGNGDRAVSPNTQAQRLVPEGTFVVDRPGRVTEGVGGNLEFVFDADGQTTAGAGDPPMVLVPNLNLQAMERAWTADKDRRFRITGRVTEYRGRNHLQLDKVIVLN